MTFWKKDYPENKAPQSANPLKSEAPKPEAKPELKPTVLDAPPKTATSTATSSAAASPSESESIASRYTKVRSALGAGTVIQGKLSFDTAVSIDGKLSGEIFSTEALIVGNSGMIDAQVEVRVLVVSGTVRGKIVARERVELLSGGRIEGTVTTPSLKMEENSVLNAKVAMSAVPTQIVTLDDAQGARTASGKEGENKSKDKSPSAVEAHPSMH